MAEHAWTAQQRQAISARRGTLLVSAAAGSGKTAVLVERVIERLTDTEHPCDADRILVVTFTNAAAAEMKERISSRLSALLEEDPYNSRLRHQQLLLNRAHISTIHSFCSELVREYFYQLDISPEFRIPDDAELALLREETLRNVLEEHYAQNVPEFLRMVENFSSGRDDSRLLSTVETLYDFVRSHPFPEAWLREKEEMYYKKLPIGKTPWGREIFAYAQNALDYCGLLGKASVRLLEEDEKIGAAYSEALFADLRDLEHFQSLAEAGEWDAFSSALLSYVPVGLKPLRGYKDNPVKLKVCANRDELKKTLKKLSKLFWKSEAESAEDLKELAPVVSQLFACVRDFSDRFEKVKSERRLADYSDLEHWTLRLLVQNDGENLCFTEEAREISGRFEEIMVDEYQDVNEVQDTIFRALSRNEQNLFLVGDVKQSVYRFRQAMPEIFLRRKERYPKYESEKDQYPATVILDRNFRSRSGVTDAVNFVFGQLMSRRLGEMDYTEEEALLPGALYPPKQEPDTAIHIIDLSSPNTEEEKRDISVLEARQISAYIAQKISSGALVTEGAESRAATYRDFCVLLRNANVHAAAYAKELQLHGIPARCDIPGSFFGTPEVASAIAFLRVIDNPVQDIPLLSVLMSPIYGFTPDALAEIRLKSPKTFLYFTLKKAANDGNEDCRRFLEEMEDYRRLAATMSADRLIGLIFEKTGFLAMAQAMPNGELRLANLRKLLEYARSFESSGSKGISGFVRFIDRLEQRKSDLAPASSLSESANVVRVMSIHRSKGLEFPFCILAGCARSFNGEKGEILLHPRLGIGIRRKAPKTFFYSTTVPREAVSLAMEHDGLSEELRLLYVAMTRAKEQLVMVSTLRNAANTLGRLASRLNASPRLAPYVVRSAGSFSDWILSCALRHPDGFVLRSLAGADDEMILPCSESWNISLIDPLCDEKKEGGVLEKEPPEADTEFLETIGKRLSYFYPYASLGKVPAKVAASELAGKTAEREYAAIARPAFLMGQSLTAAEKGTAVHAYMEFADYARARKKPEEHLRELTQKGFLSAEQAKAVDLTKITRFFESKLASRILSSPKLLREFRFTVLLDAGELTPGLPDLLKNEKVVLQGAVDCAFLEDGELVVVDYKTDYAQSEELLAKRYAPQLLLYRRALEECTEYRVKECLLYSFELGKAIKISG